MPNLTAPRGWIAATAANAADGTADFARPAAGGQPQRHTAGGIFGRNAWQHRYPMEFETTVTGVTDATVTLGQTHVRGLPWDASGSLPDNTYQSNRCMAPSTLVGGDATFTLTGPNTAVGFCSS